MYVCIYVCMYVCMYVHTYVYVLTVLNNPDVYSVNASDLDGAQAQVYVRMCVCVCVCVCSHVSIYRSDTGKNTIHLVSIYPPIYLSIVLIQVKKLAKMDRLPKYERLEGIHVYMCMYTYTCVDVYIYICTCICIYFSVK